MCKVAQRLAAEYGVSEKTIIRDGEFSTAVDYLGLRSDIVSGKCKLSKSKIVAMYKQSIGAAMDDKRVGLNVKVSAESHAMVARLAAEAGVDMGSIIDALCKKVIA